MVPQGEARIDPQQMQLACAITLEVELGDAEELKALDDIAAELAHVGGLRQLQRRGVAVTQRIGADLAAGELTGDGAGLVDVTVVAFDLRFRAGDQLLRQQLDSGLQ